MTSSWSTKAAIRALATALANDRLRSSRLTSQSPGLSVGAFLWLTSGCTIRWEWRPNVGARALTRNRAAISTSPRGRGEAVRFNPVQQPASGFAHPAGLLGALAPRPSGRRCCAATFRTALQCDRTSAFLVADSNLWTRGFGGGFNRLARFKCGAPGRITRRSRASPFGPPLLRSDVSHCFAVRSNLCVSCRRFEFMDAWFRWRLQPSGPL